MIFGKQTKNDGTAVSHGMPETNSDIIFEATSADFQDRVLERSMSVPVIADFWAPWCGPCKQLTPLLEKAVRESGGTVSLAKINVDDNQELAQAMRIQSLPTVYAFFGGRPVDAFQGLLPESQIKAFIHKITQAVKDAQPDALDIPEALKQAAQALAEGDLATAQGIYAQILQQDPQSAEAYTGMVRTLIQAGQIEQARGLIDTAPPEIAAKGAFSEAKTALELAEEKPKSASAELTARLERDPGNHVIRYDLAVALFAEGAREAAMDVMLEIIAQERDWNDGAAREKLLKFFQAMGPTDPLTMQTRRRLSSLLFS